jgi:hypothetical protein
MLGHTGFYCSAAVRVAEKRKRFRAFNRSSLEAWNAAGALCAGLSGPAPGRLN